MTSKNIIVLAFVVETLCVTYFLSFPSLVPIASLMYGVSGGVLALGLLYLPQAHLTLHIPQISSTFKAYKLALLVIMGIMVVHFGVNYMRDVPLNYQEADMLPIIKIMSRRFVEGHWRKVYDIIPNIWQGVRPIYLPAMWMPFSLAEWAGVDIRWVTLLALWISFGVVIVLWNPFFNPKLSLPFGLAVFLLFWWVFTNESSGLIPYTEEGVVIMNYVWLTLALLSENYLLIGIAASLCALSRYSLAGWLPAMLILLYIQQRTKQWIHLKIGGIVGFVLLVLIPFGWNLVGNFIQLPGAYIDFAKRVWHDGPHVFYVSLGFAKFFGPQKIALQHTLLISFSFAVPMVFTLIAGWYNLKRSKKLHNIPLAALKITLVVFYSLIDVPYLYLFYTSSFVSMVAVAYWLTNNESHG